MPYDERITTPDDTSLRVALWRAPHLHLDPAPDVLADGIAPHIVGPSGGTARTATSTSVRSTRARRGCAPSRRRTLAFAS
ncbi:hypothetical protein [Embleya sp. NPDC020630]|uniref:hypothetical protein n=1 Tax=Embleya sp. NPDC020630 TaxID=3363979 RepID=UPI0037B37B6C